MAETVKKYDFFVAEENVDHKQFVRDSYIELYSAKDTMENIDDIQFSDVFEDPYMLELWHCEYDINYMVEVGYDRIEQYIDKVTEYDRSLERNVTRDVVKTRTVTDWSPYNGSDADVPYYADYCVLIREEMVDIGDVELNEKYHWYLGSNARKICSVIANREATAEEVEKFAYDAEDRMKIITTANDSVFYPRLSFPGDHNRNFRTTKKELKKVEGAFCSIKRCKLAFDYNGEKCFVKQFPTEEKPSIYCSSVPENTAVSEIYNEEKRVLEEPNKEKETIEKKFQKLFQIGALIAIASFAVSFLLIPLFIVGALITVVYFYSVNKRKKEALAPVEEKINSIKEEFKEKRKNQLKYLQDRKIELLEARFAKLGFSPLTDEEKERFSAENACKIRMAYLDY